MELEKSNYKTIFKSHLISFLSYGILTIFIFIVLAVIIKYALSNFTNIFLYITFSLIGGILLYYLFHFICKSSTIESFKKLKLSKEHEDNFIKKMNLFFIICIIISVVCCVTYLLVNHIMYINSILQAYEQYHFISDEFANEIILSLNEEYYNSLPIKVSCTLILGLSVIVSFYSLIPYQKKMVEKYNESTD